MQSPEKPWGIVQSPDTDRMTDAHRCPVRKHPFTRLHAVHFIMILKISSGPGGSFNKNPKVQGRLSMAMQA
jgi:hypothetical protein